MRVELTSRGNRAAIETKVEYRQHLNDLLHDAGYDYDNRPGGKGIVIYIDADSDLCQVHQWLQNANAGIRGN